MGRTVAQCIMQPLGVVEPEVLRKAVPGVSDALVTVKIHLLLLHGPPQTLDKDIVEDPSSAVHAYPDSGGLKPSRKLIARKLRSLVTVEHLGLRDR